MVSGIMPNSRKPRTRSLLVCGRTCRLCRRPEPHGRRPSPLPGGPRFALPRPARARGTRPTCGESEASSPGNTGVKSACVQSVDHHFRVQRSGPSGDLRRLQVAGEESPGGQQNQRSPGNFAMPPTRPSITRSVFLEFMSAFCQTPWAIEVICSCGRGRVRHRLKFGHLRIHDCWLSM